MVWEYFDFITTLRPPSLPGKHRPALVSLHFMVAIFGSHEDYVSHLFNAVSKAVMPSVVVSITSEAAACRALLSGNSIRPRCLHLCNICTLLKKHVLFW